MTAVLLSWWDRLIAWLVVDGWLSRCQHNPNNVAVDILAGDEPNPSIAYCNRCGAAQIRRVIGPAAMRCGEWRRPRPLWCEP